MAERRDSGGNKEAPAHDGGPGMNLPPKEYLAAEGSTMYVDHQFSQSQNSGDHLQYSYRPQQVTTSGGSGMMWFGGGGDGGGIGSGGVISYGVNSSSPSYSSGSSSSGQKRTRSDQESSVTTQFPGQQLPKLQRGISQDSSSLSSGLSNFSHHLIFIFNSFIIFATHLIIFSGSFYISCDC